MAPIIIGVNSGFTPTNVLLPPIRYAVVVVLLHPLNHAHEPRPVVGHNILSEFNGVRSV